MGERTPHGPAFLVHVLPPSAPHLDLGGSVQCSNVVLCLNLHPSTGEGFLWSCLLCSRSLSFCFSFGPRELSPVFQCGSLSQSPSIPDEGSMEICKIFISMIMGQGQFRHALLCCLGNNLGTSPWTWEPSDRTSITEKLCKFCKSW